MGLQTLAVCRLEIRGDEILGLQRERPVSTRPQHHKDRKAEQDKATNRHPRGNTDMVPGEGLATKEGRSDRRGRDHFNGCSNRCGHSFSSKPCS
jgi:hypothetical protein